MSPPPASYLVLANAGAGSTAREAVALAVATLSEHAPTELCWTDDPAAFRGACVGIDDDRQLVVAGGDGSIHLALCTLAEVGRTHLPLGIIPLGTGNDFARNRSLPLDPVEAAGVIVSGFHRGIDAMVLDGEPVDQGGDGVRMVANNTHVGLGVEAARTARRMKWVLGRFAYPVATAYEGAAGDAIPLTVSADGDVVFDGPLLAVLVLLGPSMGGGVEVTPDAPRRLDVICVQPASRGERARLVGAALRHRIFDDERVIRRHASAVTIDGADGVDANVDGELLSYRGAITLTHRPEAWNILVPAAT